ncbi:hypothetical protein MTBBW1_1210039 [Desulfamplus magnetovallimortis]|uniref:Uncharacterized protein n=1 Tax=Desulfamplus magnetovallimortis TaxID=1246637 RepID=A0A1W1H698_9BACT|nr:hypothetical protein MTBBW1_1210039 [Desulfamplus magnetovallimortis]
MEKLKRQTTVKKFWKESIEIGTTPLSKLKIRVRLTVETRHALSLRCR